MATAGLGASSTGTATQIATVRVGDRRTIVAVGTATADGAQLELRGESDRTGLRVELHVGEPAHLVVIRDPGGESRVKHVWSMVRGLGPHSQRDVLRVTTRWIRRQLVAPLHSADRDYLRDARFEAQVHDVVRAVAVAAIERCDPAARSLAMRFLPHLRFRIYARLIADRSGRLAELVSTCPGALIFAIALLEHDQVPASVAAGQRLLDDVVAGRRLAPALDDAIDGWCTSSRERGVLDPSGGAFVFDDFVLLGTDPRPRALDSDELSRVRADQRILIRRALPQVATSTLWRPPPLALVPEDIPRAVRANARWFRLMKLDPLTMVRLEGVAPRQQDDLCRFVSLHAAHFGVGHLALQRARLAELLDYARATGRWPNRASELANVLAASTRWHVEMIHVRDPRQLGFGAGAGSDVQLPPPRFAPGAIALPRAELVAIDTAQGLIAEGREMQHCVASRIHDALAGRALVFRGVVRGERVTVELVCRHGVWGLGDARCAHNRLPSAASTQLIHTWAAAAVAHQQGAGPLREVPTHVLKYDDEIPF